MNKKPKLQVLLSSIVMCCVGIVSVQFSGVAVAASTGGLAAGNQGIDPLSLCSSSVPEFSGFYSIRT